ncbi:MAG: 3-dehydroquinate synthase, partial [Rhizobiales bacterium]|nr:3-dehydroquinate synthase [Hyphomicrobiales bacterium]
MTVLPRSGDLTTVAVDLSGRPYDIIIGRDVLQELGARVAKLRPGAAVCIVTDRNVAKHHLAAAMSSIERAGARCARV